MNRFLLRAIVLLCALSLLACTTTQVIDHRSIAPNEMGREARQAIQQYDFVTVKMSDGSTVQVVVSSIGDEAISGKLEGGENELIFAFNQIQSISVHRKSPWKTIGLATATAIGAAAVLLVLAVATGFMRSGSK
jgi:hypothetical protein